MCLQVHKISVLSALSSITADSLLVLGLLLYSLYNGTFWQRGLCDYCFQNPSESSDVEASWSGCTLISKEGIKF